MEVDYRTPNQQFNSQEHYLVKKDNKLRCVCEMCTCGKHKCPRPRIKGTFSTSYNDHYKNIKFTQSPPLKQEYRYEQRHYNPDALRTSYQDTYVPMQMQNINDSPSKLQGYGSRILNQVPFVGQSSYKEQYKPYIIKPNSQNPQQENIFRTKSVPNQFYKPIKFQGTTSYKAHYVEPPKMEKKPIPEYVYPRAQIPFNGSSSYKNDFPRYNIQPQKSVENAPLYVSPQIKFENTTSYNEQYKAYQLVNPEDQLAKSRTACIVQKLAVPAVNYINDQNHIYYDEEAKKFV